MTEWRYDGRRRVFVHEPTGYEIDRKGCAICARLLDWIFQIAGKNGDTISNESRGQLVRLIHEIIEPQATMCSFGQDIAGGPGKSKGNRMAVGGCEA